MKMELNHIKMTRAISEVGKLIAVEDASNGRSCNCSCIVCGSALIAKQGKKRSWHFAHAQNEIDCSWSGETELHLRVKEFISKAPFITLPIGINYPALEEIKIDDTEVEIRLDPTRRVPDVTIYSEGERLYVEIAVSHFCDSIKKQELKKNNANAIEFDFSDFVPEGDVITDSEIEKHLSLCRATWLSVSPAGHIGSKVHDHERNSIRTLNEDFKIKKRAKVRELDKVEELLTSLKKELTEVENTLKAKSPTAHDRKRLIAEYDLLEQNLANKVAKKESEILRTEHERAINQFNASFDSLKRDLEIKFREENMTLALNIDSKKEEYKNLSNAVFQMQEQLNAQENKVKKLRNASSHYVNLKNRIDEASTSLDNKIRTIAQTRIQLNRILPEFEEFCRKTGAPWPFSRKINDELETDIISKLFNRLPIETLTK